MNLQKDFVHLFFLFLRLLSRGYDVSAIGLGGRVGNSTVGTSGDHEVEDI